nr:hypothetical protein [Phycisphaerae bacterium]
LLKNPVNWPPTWCDRTLDNTPAAYIYATSGAAAGEADTVIRDVAATYTREAGGPPAKGLVIVTDLRDPLCPGKWRELRRLARRQEKGPAAPESAPASASASSPASAPESAPASPPEEDDQMVADLGISWELLFRMAPVGLSREQAPKLIDLPEPAKDEVAWVAILPTRALLTDCNRQLVRAAYKKQKIGLAAQAMMAPMMAIMETKMVDILAAMREVAVFMAYASAHPLWSTEEKRARQDAYREARMHQAKGAMISAAEDAAGRDKATSPPTSTDTHSGTPEASPGRPSDPGRPSNPHPRDAGIPPAETELKPS